MRSWLNPTSVLGGVLAVLTCAYLAAVFLVAEAHRAGRARSSSGGPGAGRSASAVVAGAMAVAGLFVLHHDAHRLFERLLHAGWPLVAVSAVAGLAALLARPRPRCATGPPWSARSARWPSPPCSRAGGSRSTRTCSART